MSDFLNYVSYYFHQILLNTHIKEQTTTVMLVESFSKKLQGIVIPDKHNVIPVVVITTAQLHSTKPCSRCVGDSRWWRCLTVISAGNKAKRPSSVNYTTKTIHHHHHHYMLYDEYQLKILNCRKLHVMFLVKRIGGLNWKTKCRGKCIDKKGQLPEASIYGVVSVIMHSRHTSLRLTVLMYVFNDLQ